VLVFSRTKHNADRIVRVLSKAGIGSQAIHGIGKVIVYNQRQLIDINASGCNIGSYHYAYLTRFEALLKQPVKITITPKSSTVDTIEQTIYFVEKKEKSRAKSQCCS